MRPKLTNSAVEKFQCRDGREQDTLWCGETRGFGVRVSSDGQTRTYFLQFRVKGTRTKRYITIGRHNDPWRVDDARAKAVGLKAQMLNGIDPVVEDERKQEEARSKAALNEATRASLREVMQHYLIHKRTKHGPLRPATQEDIRRHVETNLSAWADKPIAKITRDMCLVRFTELSARAPTQANQCMVYLRALLNHARELFATEDGEYPVLAVNPVTRMFKISSPNPSLPKTTRIPLNRVGAVWIMLQKRRADARTFTERTSADWVCFILLTGARRKESGSIIWCNVDLDERVFSLDRHVVKNHNGITLPMSTVLHEILKARKDIPEVPEKVARRRRRPSLINSEYVFPSSGKRGYIDAAHATMKAVSEVAGTHISFHAFRRTIEDVAKACKVDPDERRQLLNHVADDVHGTHYSNNPDPKVLAPAVEAIANWIVAQGRIAEAQATGANVIPLRA